MRNISFSRTYPSYHPKAGEPTYFVEKIYKSILKPTDHVPITGIESGLSLFALAHAEPKHHTIRAGHRWKAGDWFQPVCWSGKPYRSKVIKFAPPIQIKKTWDFDIAGHEGKFFIDGKTLVDLNIYLDDVAANDGLEAADFKAWFQHPKAFDGQIICWNEEINY